MVTRAKRENNPGSRTRSKTDAVESADESDVTVTSRVFYIDESTPGSPRVTESPTVMPVLGREQITSGGISGWYAVIREISPATSAVRFAEAVKADTITDGNNGEIVRRLVAGKDGKAQRYLITRGYQTSRGWKAGQIIWVGSLELLRKYRAFRITSNRTLEKLNASRHATVKCTDEFGKTVTAEVTFMNLRAAGDKASWIDDLDLHGSSQTNLIKSVLIAMSASQDDDCLVIRGQGPVYLANGELLLATRSVVYDTDGNARDDVQIDIDAVITQASLRYYDVTPRGEISSEQITAGIGELRLALAESPDYPEIPAAFTGQLYTSPLATIYRELWSGVQLSGVRGSGKTHYCIRWDSVQSRTLRKSLAGVRPVLPLGDTTGTIKGQQIRSCDYGGYAITTDDVIKKGDSAARIAEQTGKIQNLVRSFETGGSARGTVDYKIHDVKDGRAPELSSCMKITSEKPLEGDSLQNRLIMLPHITDTWGLGGFFDPEIATRLTTPESRELQHLAWSAYVHFMISNTGRLLECLAEAMRETGSWELNDARQSERYAAILSGHYMFREFAAEYGIDYGSDARNCAGALRKCARRQAGNSVPLAERFATAIRLQIADGAKLAYPGPPEYDPDGTQRASYSAPGVIVPGEPGEDGITEDKRDLGGFTYDELGMTVGTGSVAKPGASAKILGYLIPPRSDSGGKNGDPLTRRWLIVHKRDPFTALCDHLTKAYRDRDWVFDPKDVRKSLISMGMGNQSRIYVGGKQDRYTYIDAEFVLKSRENDNDD